MQLFESTYFNVRMQVPDSWQVRAWPDDGMEELGRFAATWKPGNAVDQSVRTLQPLLNAQLTKPGGRPGSDALIDLKAWVQSDGYFLDSAEGKSLTEWNIN